MSKAKIDTILFDFFDVIHADHQKAWLRKHGYEREGEFAATSDDLDNGLVNIDKYFERYAAAHRDKNMTAEEVRLEFIRLSVVDLAVKEIVLLLKSNGYKVGLLTNTSGDSLRPLLVKNDLYALFDEIVISGEVGMSKPNEDIFQFILERLESKVSESAFFDDEQCNVDAANAIGITARLFTSADKLRADLIELGLLAK